MAKVRLSEQFTKFIGINQGNSRFSGGGIPAHRYSLVSANLDIVSTIVAPTRITSSIFLSRTRVYMYK